MSPDPRRQKVLMLNLGREHDDTPLIAEALVKDHGLLVERRDLFKANLDKIDFSNLAAVDLKDCRGWQNNFDFFQKQVRILQKKIAETHRDIPIVNPPEMFNWIASKEYLRELEEKSVPIIPTTFLHRGEAWPDIQSMLDGNPDKRIVLKPARGSRNSNIIFVKKLNGDAFELTSPKPLAESRDPHVMTVTRKNLDEYLRGYAHRLFYGEQQPAILIQPYCRGTEISAVLIGKNARVRKDEVHFVERTVGDLTLVAHEDFGGTNKAVANPDPEVVAFARQVKEALPGDLQSTPYVRIDMLHEKGKKPVLMEVEAGSARLFLKETQKTNEYADMLADCIVEARRKSRLSRPSPGAAMQRT